MGLWYTNDSGFKLTGFSDADYVGCKDTFKSTSGGTQFLGEKLLMDYGYHFNKILIYCDSKSAIAISFNPVQHSRTKHIAVRYHFIKEHVEKGMIELYFIKIDYQLADLFTKVLLVDRFNYLVCRLGMHNLSPQEPERLAKSRQNQRDLLRNSPSDRVEVLEIGSMHNLSAITKMILILKTSHHGPTDARYNPSQLLRLLLKEVCFISHGDQHVSIGILIPRSLILKRLQSAPAFDYQITNVHL
ncbi:hypothetical protein Tco_1575733 [Tanacetum coccineum]